MHIISLHTVALRNANHPMVPLPSRSIGRSSNEAVQGQIASLRGEIGKSVSFRRVDVKGGKRSPLEHATHAHIDILHFQLRSVEAYRCGCGTVGCTDIWCSHMPHHCHHRMCCKLRLIFKSKRKSPSWLIPECRGQVVRVPLKFDPRKLRCPYAGCRL